MNILIYILALFGCAEIITNGIYIIVKKEVAWGKVQHSELPSGVSDVEVKFKVRRMLALGVLMLAGVLIATTTDMSSLLLLGPVGFVAIVAYEAWRYRYWKIYSELGVAVVMLSITIWVVFFA